MKKIICKRKTLCKTASESVLGFWGSICGTEQCPKQLRYLRKVGKNEQNGK